MSTNTEHNYPLVYAKPPIVRLAICYNPFLPHDLNKFLLVYNQYNTLADYLEGLPQGASWGVAYNGEPVEKKDWGSIKPQPNSVITIVRMPEGGGSQQGKDILRIVAMIALAAFVAVVAPYAVPWLMSMGMSAAVATAVATAALTVAGSMVINALLPAQQLNHSSGPKSTSYAIDGPKNTAKEGVPVPVVYGTYRVGGNIVDLYTRNIGDDQYLFMRTVLNDGPVKAIRQIQVNGQDIANFRDVEYRVSLGNPGGDPSPWFHQAIALVNLQQKITTGGVLYTTSDAVDRIRVDVAFPTGLTDISKKSGNHYDKTIQLGIEYRAMSADGTTATGSWAPIPLEMEQPLDLSGGGSVYNVSQTDTARFTLVPDAPTSGNTWQIEAQYKSLTETTWHSFGVKQGPFISNAIFDTGYFADSSIPTVPWVLNFPSVGDWEVRFIGGDIQTTTTEFGNRNTSTQYNVPGTVTNLTVTRNTTDPFRLTYQSATLPHGRYQVRVYRNSVEDSDTANHPSACYVTDIGEVENENVSYDGVAMLSLKIKLNDQLSSQPTVTALVDGSLVNIYDDDGNVVSTEWSDNPADIVMDMLLNSERGGGYDSTKVIWSKITEFREHCSANNLAFNGVFDFITTLWDGMQSVARVGRGMIIPQGTRYTVAIDKADDPVMVFTGSNMFMDTFQKTWVNLADRANEIQQSFYDAESGYRERVVRLPDAAAQSRGEKPKPANTSGFGITNATQATREAEYQARHNSYTTNYVTFDAPIEAIGLSIADVCLIQHDSIKYADGVGGRIEAASTTTAIALDRPVTMTAGNTYSILINTDALLLYTVNVTAKTGNKVTITGLPTSGLPRIRRLVQGAYDREVYKILSLGGGTYVFTLDDASDITTGSVTLWDTDVIVERQVVFVEGESTSVTLTAPLSAVPKQYSNFLFGQVAVIKQPYRLVSIAGDEDISKRTLSFVNYDHRIYEDGSWGVPTLSQLPTSNVSHVTQLHATWDKLPEVDQQRIKVRLDWLRPSDGTAYAGADIYVQQNSGDWIFATTVSTATSWQADYNRGDLVVFKVVAFDTSGHRAVLDTAPTVGLSLVTSDRNVDPPTSLNGILTKFDVTGTAHLTWVSPTVAPDYYEIATKAITPLDYNTFVDAGADETSYPSSVLTDAGYVVFGTTPDTKIDVVNMAVADYAVRVRSVQGYAVSDWVYLPLQVGAPSVPATVTNLRLANPSPSSALQFDATDAHFVWDDVLTQQTAATGIAGHGLVNYLLDYRVSVYDATTNALLRTEYMTSPEYVYTLAKNQSDSAALGYTARRSFKVVVAIRGKQGQISSTATITVSNPAPDVPAVTIVKGTGTTTLNYAPPTDSDFRGIIVWASLASGFTPGSSNLVYQGSGAATFDTADGSTYFYRYALYDAFGAYSLNVSDQQSFVAGSGLGVDIATLRQEWVVKTDTDGRITGIYQLSSDTTQDFVMVADHFAIKGPDGTPYTPFEVDTVNDIVKMTNVEVDTLKAGSVTSASLAPQAVTNQVFTHGTNVYVSGTSSDQTAISADITTTGGRVRIFATFITGIVSGGGRWYVKFYRDGSQLFEIPYMQNGNFPSAWPMLYVDETPPPGAHTYEIKLHVATGDSDVTFSYASLELLEIKA